VRGSVEDRSMKSNITDIMWDSIENLQQKSASGIEIQEMLSE
jgi:hypothetical protein